MAALRGGKTPGSLAAAEGVTMKRPDWISASPSGNEEDVGQRIRRVAFRLAPPQADEPRFETVSTAGGRAVVILQEVRLPEPSPEMLASTRQQRRQRLSQAELEAWISNLKASADIERFDDDNPGEDGAG